MVVTSVTGGAGQSVLEWRGYGERFTFSGDGRYFALVMAAYPPESGRGSEGFEYLLASTDGSRAWHLSAGPTMLAFSPDSTRVSYVTVPEASDNEMGIMDISTGEQKVLAGGGVLVNPTWVNDRTIVYTRLHNPVFSPRQEGGVVFRVDTDSGEALALTGPGRSFSIYSAPVSFSRSKIALTEKEPLYNLWSLDVGSGELRQVTNNNLFHFRAGYLPQGNLILFETQKNPDDMMSSEIAVMADDGSYFRMLTSNFSFDGVHSFSPDSGRIAFQRLTEKGEASIWTLEGEEAEAVLIAADGGGWLGDPNFAPVPDWQAANPLEMAVEEGILGKALAVSIKNPSSAPVKTVLRAFPGSSLELAAEGGPAVSQTGPGPAAPKLEWSLNLDPGETVEIRVTATPSASVAAAGKTSLLLTLAVPGTPPRMNWQYLE
ncbi:MAG: hypothetical protein IBX61_02225 [Thermoleophilia bacterium]|nr:hypothetical protein [Thermoleophilia bacterium]